MICNRRPPTVLSAASIRALLSSAWGTATTSAATVAECIELVLSDDDLGADINPAVQVDHVVVDKTEAAG